MLFKCPNRILDCKNSLIFLIIKIIYTKITLFHREGLPSSLGGMEIDNHWVNNCRTHDPAKLAVKIFIPDI